MAYETTAKGPFTAGKDNVWVQAETLDECAALYAKAAQDHQLGMGTIYRTEDPMGRRYFINANGAIVEEV